MAAARSTGWSSGSATRATATRARATTSASRWPPRPPQRWGLPKAKTKYAGLYTDGRAGPGGPRVGVLLPQTHMNDSGRAAGPARGALGVPLDRVVAVHDEIDLPFGRVEARLGGGLAGHNGLKSLKQRARRPRLPAHPRGRGPPRLHRPGDRLGLGAGPLPRAAGRGARARGARQPTPCERLLSGAGSQPAPESPEEPRGCPGGRLSRKHPARPGAPDAIACSARSSHMHVRRPRSPRSPTPRAASRSARSCRPACARTCSRRLIDHGSRAARRSWWRATTAPPATSPPTCAPTSRRARCASTRRGASATSPTWPRRRTSWACASPRSTRCSGRQPAVLVTSAVALAEKVPDPGAAPARLRDREGRPARPRGDRRPARGLRLRARGPGGEPRPVRPPRGHPRRLSGHRGARRALRAVRRGGGAPHLVLHVHPALAGGGRAGGDRACGRAGARAARAGRDARPRATSRSARTWPTCCRWTASASCSTWCRPNALIAVAAEEELAPSLRDYWEDVTTSFHDEDAHHLYVPPDRLDAALDERAAAAAVQHLPGPAARVPRAERRHRGPLAEGGGARAREAGALGLPDVRGLGAARRGRARPLQPGPGPRRLPRRQAGVRRSRA